jgi:hypothetical protein
VTPLVEVIGLPHAAAMRQRASARLADGALAKPERRLLRRRQLVRDSRRRPKKYFAAARALRDKDNA